MKAYPMVLYVLLLVVACSSGEMSVAEQEANKQRASPVIVAINDYYETYHVYPTQLSELQPEFIPELPLTTLDLNFNYRLSVKHEYYYLCFDGPEGRLSRAGTRRSGGCCYISRFEDWDCTEGD